MPDIGRNDPCRCGSGKKYKKCCEGKDQQKRSVELEKSWAKAEKEFEKEKKSAPQTPPGTSAQPPKPGAPAPQAHASRHRTIPAPKFNMPRKTGGG